MSNQTTRVPTAQTRNNQETDPVEVLAREFGKEVGTRVGNALAREIHEDPELRRVAVAGAGIGVGVVIGVGLLTLISQ